MRKSILFIFLTQFVFSQNIPIEVVSGLTPGLSALEIHNNYIYYTKTSIGQHIIGRVNYLNSNSTPEIINSNVYTPFGITIHNNILYFTELIPRRISKIDLLDSSLQTEVLPITWDDDGPMGIKVYDDELYFSEDAMNLKKVPLTNVSLIPELVCTYIPHQFSFVKEGNFIYTTAFADNWINNIFRVDLSDPLGSEPEDLGEIFEPISMVKMGNLIFVSTNQSKIYRIDLNNINSGPELFYEPTDGMSFIGNIKDYNNELYFTFNKANFVTETYEGKIMKFSQSQLSTQSSSSNSKVTISPNPTNDLVTINSLEAKMTASIYDLVGKKVNAPKTSENTFDVSNLVTGTYVLKIVNNNSIITQKFIKK